MSIPVHFNGSLLNIMGGGAASPPPEVTTFTTVKLNNRGNAEANIFLSQLYFGTQTTAGVGHTTDKTTFLAQQPGLTLQPFTGIASPGTPVGVPPQTFTGFTITQSATPTGIIVVENKADTGGPYDNVNNGFGSVGDLLILTFSPAVSAVGFNWTGNPFTVDITTFNGATMLDQQLVQSSTAITLFTTFYGYST